MASAYAGLRVLLPFLDKFEQPGYSHGKWQTTESGWQIFDFSPDTEAFFHALYDFGIVYDFDWPKWQPEAENLYEYPRELARADTPTLRKLLTVHARKDHFCEGHLAEMLVEGHILAILRRVQVLEESGEEAVVSKSRMWMVRAARGGVLAGDFHEKGVVAIGWNRLGDFSHATRRDEILALVAEAYPDNREQQNIMSASQAYRFRTVMAVGDRAITYDPDRRVYLVGTLTSDYTYDPSVIEEYPNVRTVKWDGEVTRDSLSVPTKNSLGAISTLFRVPEDAAREIESRLKGDPLVETEDEPEDVEQIDLLRDFQAKSHEFIKDKIVALDWDQMQELVAGLLRAMGYKTRVSPRGADRGKDIVASPDGFGFEQPRVVVEVKHRTGSAMGAHEVRSFLGGRHKDDKGLYVSTGGFSKDARYEAERASIPLMLMDADDLVRAIVEHYDKMDPEARNLLSLTRVYWPT